MFANKHMSLCDKDINIQDVLAVVSLFEVAGILLEIARTHLVPPDNGMQQEGRSLIRSSV